MKNKVKVVLNIAGLNELRNSDEMVEILEELAGEVQNAAGGPEDYTTEVYHAPTRAVARIQTESLDAMRRNLDGNELLCALGSVGPYKEV